MKQVATVFAYTLKDGIKKKAFIISTVVIMVLILLLSLAPRVMNLINGDKEKGGESGGASSDTQAVQVDEDASTCYLIDSTGVFEGNLDMLQSAFTNWKFETVSADKEEEIRGQIKENEDLSLVSITTQDGMPFIKIVNANFMNGISSQNVSDICNKIWQKDTLKQSGVDEATIAQASMAIPYAEESVGEMDVTGYILGLILVFIMFFAVYYYGYGVAMSIASEKTSRVMETLVVSAKPSRILVGKCLAMGVLGLLQMTALLAFAFICYTALVPKSFAIGGMTLDFSNITPGTILILIIYFLLGYALYAVMNSVCGAAVSKVEDLNSAMMPVVFISLGAFYLGYFTAVAGGGSGLVNKIAMYLPFSSPFSVPFTLLTGGMKTGDLVISIGLLVIFIVVIATVSIRVYNASVLHYGNKLKMKELLKMR